MRLISSEEEGFQIPVESDVYNQLVEITETDHVNIPYSSHSLTQLVLLVGIHTPLTTETYRLIDFLDLIHVLYIHQVPCPEHDFLIQLSPAIQEYFSLFECQHNQQLDNVIKYFRIRKKLHLIDLKVPGGPTKVSVSQADIISASQNGHLEIVQILLSSGANVHAKNDEALKWASINGRLEVVLVLLSAGADVHVDDDYPLQLASSNGHVEVVRVLLSAGANVHVDDNYALRSASRHGHLEVVRVLLSPGADVHADNDYALRLASRYGYLEVVRVLLSSGANLHAEDDYSLQWAYNNGHLEVVKMLLSSGADVHADNDIAF